MGWSWLGLGDRLGSCPAGLGVVVLVVGRAGGCPLLCAGADDVEMLRINNFNVFLGYLFRQVVSTSRDGY